MKKYRKNKLLFLMVLTVLLALPIFSVQAKGKTCRDYSFDTCPKYDSEGNYCEREIGCGCYVSEVSKSNTCNLSDQELVCKVKKSRCNWNDGICSKSHVGGGESKPEGGGRGCTDPAVNAVESNAAGIKATFKCSDVKYLTSAWLFIRIAAPFIIVLLGSLDFFKSMIAGDEKKMKESRGKFIKRLIAFGLLIVLPFVVQFVFSVMGTYGSENVCLVKCIVTNDTSDKGCD